MATETERRSKFNIVSEILTLCKNPIKKTRIMNYGNLSFEQTKKYLEVLILKGLIRRNCEGFYQTTRFGDEFSEGLTTLLLLWNNNDVERLVSKYIIA